MPDERKLSVEALLSAGFKEYDSWLIHEERLVLPRLLPTKPGVYAFACGDIVLYVGLASKSLKQRLSFYRNFGADQPTNVRLNELIRATIAAGDKVRILLAHPGDGEWNGLRLRGPEGLEAALIEDFELQWNIKGSATAKPTKRQRPNSSTGHEVPIASVSAKIVSYVAMHPECSELEIARAIFGPEAVQPRINAYCRRLANEGKITRLPTRPFTYIIREPKTHQN